MKEIRVVSRASPIVGKVKLVPCVPRCLGLKLPMTLTKDLTSVATSLENTIGCLWLLLLGSPKGSSISAASQ